MRAWAGFLAGIVVGALAVAWVAGGTRADFYVRASAGGRDILDARVDEGAIGRAINIPAATLGEASVRKRSWGVLTTYEFTLRLRPELSGDAAAAVRGLDVSVRLPGRVTATNASKLVAGAAVWEGLPAEALLVRTRAVQGSRLLVLAAVTALALALYRRR